MRREFGRDMEHAFAALGQEAGGMAADGAEALHRDPRAIEPDVAERLGHLGGAVGSALVGFARQLCGTTRFLHGLGIF